MDKDKAMDKEHNAQLLEMLDSGTDKQRESYETLPQRWDSVGTPTPLMGDEDTWVVEVARGGESPHYTTWILIEPDGHTHS